MGELIHFGKSKLADIPVLGTTGAEDDADMVNHPPHYTEFKGFEVIDIVEQLDYLRGNAVKYIMRAGKKWDAAQDIDKAIWYLNRYKDRLDNE